MSLVNCAPLPSPIPTAQTISDSPYERKLEATVANQLTIIGNFDFNGTDVSKIGLADAVGLALDVHRWELDSYHGHPNKRMAAPSNIGKTAARRLQINMDQMLLESMKDETTLESSTETASKVKDYFYDMLRANGKVPEADVFYLTVTRLSLTLGFDKLLTAVSNKDSQSKEQARSLLLTGIDDAQEWG